MCEHRRTHVAHTNTPSRNISDRVYNTTQRNQNTFNKGYNLNQQCSFLVVVIGLPRMHHYRMCLTISTISHDMIARTTIAFGDDDTSKCWMILKKISHCIGKVQKCSLSPCATSQACVYCFTMALTLWSADVEHSGSMQFCHWLIAITVTLLLGRNHSLNHHFPFFNIFNIYILHNSDCFNIRGLLWQLTL